MEYAIEYESAESKETYCVQSHMTEHQRDRPFPEPMVPPPRYKEQSYRGNNDDPSNHPKQIGLPHGGREHDD